MANCDESSEVCEPPASCHGQAQTIRRGVPDPDIALPEIAVPTVAVWLASFTVWAAATFTVLSQPSRWWWVASIPIQGFVTFSMFTVLHESIHGAVGHRAFVNQLYGRLSMPFVSIFGTFPMLKYVHIEHHRNTNEDIHVDPDAWSLAGPGWLAPLRWLTIDAWYCHFYLSRLRRRPRGEIAGFLTNLVVVIALLCVVCALGGELKLVVIYFIPQRIGMLILAWWFDWLPHHDLGATAKVNRFRTTRLRVGWEPVMTPLLFYQNYHLVHHIHPMIPFYRYVRAWKNTQNDYLDRNVPISTAWGRELTPSEYRAWRGIDSLNDVLAASDQPARNRFHSLRVADVRRLTANSVSITFNVPSNLAIPPPTTASTSAWHRAECAPTSR